MRRHMFLEKYYYFFNLGKIVMKEKQPILVVQFERHSEKSLFKYLDFAHLVQTVCELHNSQSFTVELHY